MTHQRILVTAGSIRRASFRESGGLVRGLAMVRTWFENMRLTVATDDLSIPQVNECVTGEPDAIVFDAEFDEYCTGRPPT